MALEEQKTRRYWRKPLDGDKFKVPKGEVHVIADRCKECGLCIEYCPTEVLDWAVEFNVKGFHYPRVKPGKEGDCINCQFCEEVCPDFAIFNVKIEEAEEE